MQIEKIKNRLDELNRQEFHLNMIDYWTNEDKQQLRKIDTEKKELKKSIETRIEELNRKESSILFNVSKLSVGGSPEDKS